MIGNGTGDWDVPVGGMGALTESLAGIACAAGAELRAGVEVTAIETDGVEAEVHFEGGSVTARHVLSNVAPAVLARLLGEPEPDPRARGRAAEAQPAAQAAAAAARPVDRPARGVRGDLPRQRVRDPARASPTARRTPGRVPELAPCEIYCHSLTDPSILGAELREAGRADADVLRPAHAGAAVRRASTQAAKAEAIAVHAARR